MKLRIVSRVGIIKSMVKIPDFFQPILWSYDFNTLDTDKNKKTIVLGAINYGKWKHWRWIAEYYGKDSVASLIASQPESAFRKSALSLARIIFRIEKQNHALRSAKPRRIAKVL